MEKQESKRRFPAFPQPRRLRTITTYGIRILRARSHRDLVLEQLHDRIWILLSQQANPFLYDKILHVASEKNVYPRDVLQVMSSEEVPELILEHRGLAFLPRAAAWRIARDEITMRPLSEPELRLVTNLAMR